ncbi:unnamed protein product [Polarella glacialis]|uniref:Uncharacterized protein n=1 Tax=Polarella glacialis TaxID=89957 RepID=A0A813D025_POLGL|nr:unnamed protein product [Polarella glacialis]CAE8714584.1 unnamed protein product [Polarella glacialis]
MLHSSLGDNTLGFPMFVMLVADFLLMDGILPCHQDLAAEGKLYQWSPGMFVCFVSHQWLSRMHPDPSGQQMAILRAALKGIIEESVPVITDLIAEVGVRKFKTMKSNVKRAISNGFLWLDWISVPQKAGLTDGEAIRKMEREQMSAIQAIPDYVANSNVFMVLAPPLPHHSTAVACDFNSWYSRGWCRLEAICRLLAAQETSHEIIIIKSMTSVVYAFAAHMYLTSVGDGDFEVSSDRQALHSVLLKTINRKLDYFASQGAAGKFMHRFLTAAADRLLSGLLPSSSPVNNGGVVPFLQKYDFKSLGDQHGHEWGPLHIAAIEGNLAICQSAVAAGTNVSLLAPYLGEAGKTLSLGRVSPLHLAAISGHVEVISFLIDSKAEIHQPCSSGPDSLHLAAAVGAKSFEAISMLLSKSADANRLNKVIGGAALHHVFYNVRKSGQAGVVQLLLQHNARPDAVDIFGATLGHNAVLFGASMETVKMLLASGVSPHRIAAPRGLVGRGAVRCCRSAIWLGFSREALHAISEHSLFSWLHIAARHGRLEMVKCLLESDADPMAKSRRGETAAELARRHGFEDIYQLCTRLRHEES